MNRQILKLFLGVFTLPGCAAYQPQPLSLNHPAHEDAAPAPGQAPSLTLAYSRLQIPSSQAVWAAAATVKEPSGQIVSAEGKVVATVPSAAQIVLEHGEIKGFMDAMTMGYPVEPPSLLDGLKFGDKVRFTIDVPNKAIIKIEKIK